MDSVRSVKDLDAMNILMRKGKLCLNPRHLMVDVTINLIGKGIKGFKDTDYKIGVGKEVSPNNWDHDKELRFQKFIYSGFSTKTFKADPATINMIIRRQGNKSGGYYYRGEEAMILFNRCQVKHVRVVPGGETETEYEWGLGTHYGIKLDKLITESELSAIKDETARTPKEWCQLLRTIRKRIIKLMREGKLNGVMNRCDRLKEHKEHAVIMADVIQRTDAIKAAVLTLKGLSDEMGQKLTPFVRVRPYDEIRHQMERVESSIKSILGEIDDIEVSTGVKREKEETDED